MVKWFNEIGLNMYAAEFKRWNKTGAELLAAVPQEIDKELRICNPLHRKKLHLALEGLINNNYHLLSYVRAL